MGDVVEAKKLPRTPTNRRDSAIAVHGLDLDIAHRESRGNAEESVAGFLGLEASGGPRNEFGQRFVLWRLADVHGYARVEIPVQCITQREEEQIGVCQVNSPGSGFGAAVLHRSDAHIWSW